MIIVVLQGFTERKGTPGATRVMANYGPKLGVIIAGQNYRLNINYLDQLFSFNLSIIKAIRAISAVLARSRTAWNRDFTVSSSIIRSTITSVIRIISGISTFCKILARKLRTRNFRFTVHTSESRWTITHITSHVRVVLARRVVQTRT